jgi:hypothetical protein
MGTASFGILAMAGLDHLEEPVDKGYLIDERYSLYSPETPILVADRKFQMIGVRHNPQTLYQYQKEITEAIKNSPFVFLENFWESRHPYARPGVSWDEIFALENRWLSFQAGLGKICAEQNKDIVVVNPQTVGTEGLEFYLLLGIPIGITVHSYTEAADFLISKLAKGVTRREFLTGRWMKAKNVLRALTAASSFFSWDHYFEFTKAARTKLIDEEILTPHLTPEEQVDILGWSFFDWRCAQGARGVTKAMERYQDEIDPSQIVPDIEGNHHKLMLHYLQKPLLRAAKCASYTASFNPLGDLTIRRFFYSSSKDRWERVEKTPY